MSVASCCISRLEHAYTCRYVDILFLILITVVAFFEIQFTSVAKGLVASLATNKSDQTKLTCAN
jgi:hypothetical protein